MDRIFVLRNVENTLAEFEDDGGRRDRPRTPSQRHFPNYATKYKEELHAY